MTGISGIVRRATSMDLQAVLELDRIAPVGHERGELLTTRVQSGEVILLEHEGRVSGYAVIRSHSFFGRDFVELLANAVTALAAIYSSKPSLCPLAVGSSPRPIDPIFRWSA